MHCKELLSCYHRLYCILFEKRNLSREDYLQINQIIGRANELLVLARKEIESGGIKTLDVPAAIAIEALGCAAKNMAACVALLNAIGALVEGKHQAADTVLVEHGVYMQQGGAFAMSVFVLARCLGVGRVNNG